MRQPLNIHVYLYRKSHNDVFEYAVFQRADDPKCWQGISGGVEEGETIEQAALRESFEEAGVAIDAPLYRLDTVSFLPSDIFSVHHKWGKDVVVCPMRFFAIPFQGEIVLSNEHLDVKWCTFQNAYDIIIGMTKKLPFGSLINGYSEEIS